MKCSYDIYFASTVCLSCTFFSQFFLEYQVSIMLVYRGSADATKRAFDVITALIKDPEKDIEQLIPNMKAKVVNTNTLTFSSNVWHNSMANTIITTTNGTNVQTSNSAAMSSSVQPLQQKSQSKGSSSGMKNVTTAGRVSSNASVTSLTVSTSRMANVGANPSGGKSPATAQPPMGSFQVTNGTAIWGSPGQPPAATSGSGNIQQQRGTFVSGASGINTTTGTSKAMNQLFTESDVSGQSFGGSSTASSIALLRGTYSSPSMGKPRLVATSSPAFSTKVEAGHTSTPKAGGKRSSGSQQPHQMTPSHQQQSRNVTPGPIGRPSNQTPSYMQQTPPRPMPQPLPIKTVEGFGQGGKAPSASYSPFNNFFSQVTEGILGSTKKEEMVENRMNFASVAAAGVVPSTSNNSKTPSATASNVAMSELDPSKAPGYKGPGQRTQSPQVMEEYSRAPGYKGNAFTSNMIQDGSFISNNSMSSPYMNQTDYGSKPTHFNNRGFGNQNPSGLLSGQDFSKAPGYPRTPSGPPSQDLSPRSANSTPMSIPCEQSPRGSRANIGLLRTDDEYSSPNTPMTLPKIESTLNPNAPNFTSRTPHGNVRMTTPPPMQGSHGLQLGPSDAQSLQQGSNVHPAFRPSYPTEPSLSQLPHLDLDDLQSVPMRDLQAILSLGELNYMPSGMNLGVGSGSNPLAAPQRGMMNSKGKQATVKTVLLLLAYHIVHIVTLCGLKLQN